VDAAQLLSGFALALVIAVVTTPVGVSGAVFLLPVQLSVLQVPNPSVTPTNLMYNVISGPGALLRYRSSGSLSGPLTRRLLVGTVPGVMVGAVIRVHLLPGQRPFRIVAAAVLFAIGIWLIHRTRSPRAAVAALSDRRVTVLALAVGIVGGIYGIGGGSILGPVLVGSGMSVLAVAPAALASTPATSAVGAATYAVLAWTTPGSIAPVWSVALACGAGGLIGGYLGARVQSRVPETWLRLLLGGLAIAIGGLYVVQSL